MIVMRKPFYKNHLQKFYLIIILLLPGVKAYAQNTAENRLSALGIELLTATKPIANYVRVVRTGNLVFLAGHGPTKQDGTSITGKVGKDLTLEEGAEAARVAAIALLSSLKTEIGNLDKVKRIVKVNGWVNCEDDFFEQPKVMNGCSDLLVEIFGEKGKHARTSVGTNTLPNNIAVEIEMVVEVEQ